MPRYECRFLDHGGNIRAVEQFSAVDDEAAIRQSHEMNAESVGAGFEIRCGDRLVYQYRNRPVRR